MHPLIDDISEMKISDLEIKITELSKKYFMTANESLREQILLVLNSYKAEYHRKQQEILKNSLEVKNRGIDKLINIE